jgi:hypothetical protein
MDAYRENNRLPKKLPHYMHAVVEAKGYILKAYQLRIRKLEKYLKKGIIDDEQFLELRNVFAGNADELLRAEIKDQTDYSNIRLKAVFDTAEAHEFKL